MSTSLIILVGELLLKYGPTVARNFQILATKENPTQEDWDKNVWNVAKEPWKEYNPLES